MEGSIYKTVISLQGKITILLSILAYLVLSSLLFLVLHFKLALAEPIVILEYRKSEAINESEGGMHPFRLDPDYSAHHKVRQDETLSHIIANYYGGSGLDKAFVQMAIVKRNRSAFVRSNPNYLFAGKSLHLPSLNEIRAMLVRHTSIPKHSELSRDNREEIFFFGS